MKNLHRSFLLLLLAWFPALLWSQTNCLQSITYSDPFCAGVGQPTLTEVGVVFNNPNPGSGLFTSLVFRDSDGNIRYELRNRNIDSDRTITIPGFNGIFNGTATVEVWHTSCPAETLTVQSPVFVTAQPLGLVPNTSINELRSVLCYPYDGTILQRDPDYTYHGVFNVPGAPTWGANQARSRLSYIATGGTPFQTQQDIQQNVFDGYQFSMDNAAFQFPSEPPTGLRDRFEPVGNVQLNFGTDCANNPNAEMRATGVSYRVFVRDANNCAFSIPGSLIPFSRQIDAGVAANICPSDPHPFGIRVRIPVGWREARCVWSNQTRFQIELENLDTGQREYHVNIIFMSHIQKTPIATLGTMCFPD